jgi:plastocyanin
VHGALQLVPILGAEKSKTPFYVAGGLLVVWALTVSVAIGMRRLSFPSSVSQERAVMGVSVILVLFTVSMAVVTSGTPAKSEEAGAAGLASSKNGETTPTATTTTTSTPTTPSTSPAATTGTTAPAPAPAATGSHVSLEADRSGQLAYNTKQLHATAGTVTITMTNMSPLEHNVTVEQGTKVLGATPTFVGGSKSLTLSLKPGVYTFFCSVPGHRQAGMEGKLTVSS